MSRTLATLAALAALCLALLAPAARAQDEPRVTAQLATGVLKLGDRTSLVVIAENAGSAEITAVPTVDGLEIGPPGRPSRREQQTYSGGRVTRYVRLTWSLPIKPVREGRFTIPPLTVELGGREYRTVPQVLTVVEDLRGEELGFLTIETSGRTVVEGQPFSIELRFGWDMAIQNKINHADLGLPWWGQLPGVVELSDGSSLAGNRVNISLNGGSEVVQAEELEASVVGGARFRTFRLRRSFLAARSGELSFPVSSLEFSRVVDTGSFLRPSSKKAEAYFVLSPAFNVAVRPLPEEGRPFDFTGAVGSIEARADADLRDVTAGESIKLTVEWTGTGNFEFFELPDPSRMDAFAKLRVYGSTTVAKGPDFRRAVYDLAPLSAEIEELPPLPLRVFDTELNRYTTVSTRAIPIRVRPLPGAIELDAEERGAGPARDVADIDVRPIAARGGRSAEDAREGDSSLALVGGLLAATLAVWVFLHTLVRRRLGDPDAPVERRRRAARRRLTRDLAAATDADGELRAVQRFLAARTREPEQAWVGRDVGRWANEAAPDLDADDAAELRTLVHGLEAAVYSRRNGESPRVGGDKILGIADRLMRSGL